MDQAVLEFEKRLAQDHKEYPWSAIKKLLGMRPGVARAVMAIRLLPVLIRMARRTLAGRWHTAGLPPTESVIMTVHAMEPGGGFIPGWYSDGRWWTRDYVEDGTTWGSSVEREIRVTQYRSLEGCLAEPWHDQDRYYPPSFDDKPKRIKAAPAKRLDVELLTHTEKLYERVLRASRFIKWRPELRPSVEHIQSMLEHYFHGLDVEIERQELPPGLRSGFNIHLNSLQKEKHYSCGQDPETVTARRQMIMVQITDAAFHADSAGSDGVAQALAMGLNVYMLEELERLEKQASRDQDLLGR